MLDESPSGIAMTTNLLGTYSLPCNAVFFPAISRISVISDFCSFHKILIIRVSEVLMHFIGDEEESENDDSSTDMESSNSLRVRTLHISSPILVAQSQFSYKLFPNEEAALMDLLNFMYSNTFSATTPTAVLGVMMVADKFEVASCMKYCSHLLRNLTMTTESALLYLDLPSNILVADEVQPFNRCCKTVSCSTFQGHNQVPRRCIESSSFGIEAVLSSGNLQIASEDAVFEFVLKWARMHYPKLEERREVWSSHLLHLIRFPCMTCRKLKKVVMCTDFDPKLASKLVFEALFYKAKAPYRQCSIAAEAGNVSYHRYVERHTSTDLLKLLSLNASSAVRYIPRFEKRRMC